jgi:beta-glucosidase-like glycosyl hydrolase
VDFAALFQAVLAAVFAPAAPPPDPLASLAPRQKAALVVVSGLPAPRGVGGVLVRRWNTEAERPAGALVFADQEGGEVRAYAALPPGASAAEYRTRREASDAGKEAGRSLRRAEVDVDLAPVLDLAGGPLGSRHFQSANLGLSFARGLRTGGTAPCVKHFPGLGSAAVTTDAAPRVHARVLLPELDAFRAAVREGVPCVMVSHALYARFGGGRAVTAPGAYGLLRGLGFRGVAITDSLSIVRGRWPVHWARKAAIAGADMLLFTSAVDARRAIRALVPLARRGILDDHVRRVMRFRRSLGLSRVPRA